MISQEREGLPGCSELSSIVACPGYLQAKAAAPLEMEEPSADFGIEVHGVASGEMDQMSVGERASYVASLCIKMVDRLTKDIFGGLEGLQLWVETRFFLRDFDNKKIFSGRADRVSAKEGTFLVTDNKSLRGEISPAAENWQILGLACCIQDDDNVRGDQNIEQLYGAIIQPLVTRKPQLVRFSPDQIKTGTIQIKRALDAAKLPDAPRIPGPHCRYCPARGDCPAAISMPMVWTRVSMAPEGKDNKDRAVQLAGRLTPAQIDELLPNLALASAIIDAVRGRAKELCKEGKLPNYELKEQNGPLTITSLKQAREALDPYVTPAEFNALMTVPVTELREMFVTRFAGVNRTTKVAGGDKFSDLIAPVSQRGSATQRLARKQKQKETTNEIPTSNTAGK